jgi:hypothetical protein
MPDLVKISELSAAAALTGTEIAPIVQDGATVRATLRNIAALATQFDSDDMPNTWRYLNQMLNRGVWAGNNVRLFGDWDDAGTYTNSADSGTGSAATLLLQASRRRQAFYTATGNDGGNSAYSHQNSAASQFRRPSGVNTPDAGLFFYSRVGWEYNTSATNSCRFIIGFSASAALAIGGSDGAFDALTNVIGIGKYDTDTNVQFITNDGSGSITKVDTGVAFSALQGHLLELYMYSDYQSDSVKILLRDLDSGLDYEHEFTTQLPAGDTRLYATQLFNNGFHQDSNDLAVWSTVETVLINPGF